MAKKRQNKPIKAQDKVAVPRHNTVVPPRNTALKVVEIKPIGYDTFSGQAKIYRDGMLSGFETVYGYKTGNEYVWHKNIDIARAEAKAHRKTTGSPSATPMQKETAVKVAKESSKKRNAAKVASDARKKVEQVTGQRKTKTGVEKTVRAAEKVGKSLAGRKASDVYVGRGVQYSGSKKLRGTHYLDRGGYVKSAAKAVATKYKRGYQAVKRAHPKLTHPQAAKKYWDDREVAREKRRSALDAKKAALEAKKQRAWDKKVAAKEAVKETARAEREARYRANRVARDRKRSLATTKRISKRRALAAAQARKRLPAAIKSTVLSASLKLATKPQLVGDYLKSGNFTPAERKAITSSVPHALRYPAMKHASGKPFMAQPPLGGHIGLQKLAGKLQPASGIGTLYKTSDVLYTQDKFRDPRGIVFRVDVSEVVDMFRRVLPDSVTKSMSMSKSEISKRLMDIIEPYVPKDTGYMYTHAEELSTAADTGDVTIGGDEISGGIVGYRAPYAEIVYFDLGGHKRHGAEYNAHHGTSEKGEKETARWIEVAFEQEGQQVDQLMQFVGDKMATAMANAAKKAGYGFRSFVPTTGRTAGQRVTFAWRK